MKFKKILSVVTAFAVCSSMTLAMFGCKNDDEDKPDCMPVNTETYDIPQDYCRTYYEVFIRSFSDGNGDGIGDIRGLINNLDYLNDGDDSTMSDLGVNGIWMMPINQAGSYHKYDVIDYKSIDREYGTLDDFDELVTECNKRGIWLQMDLVLNHTSKQHKWFKDAVEGLGKPKSDKEAADAVDHYTFVEASGSTDLPQKGSWYKTGKKAASGKDYYYLGNFSSDMPDVNLDNENVRKDIKDIVDFWLNRGIKSFRLDAVPWAFDNEVQECGGSNLEFWTWFNDYCNEKGAEVAESQGWNNDGIARYCYNVGEVLTNSSIVINSYYSTGMTNFSFSLSGNKDNAFAGVAKGNSNTGGWGMASRLTNLQTEVLEKDENAILSNVLSNHDMDRLAKFFGDEVTAKKAAGLYLLSPGNPYIYYGEELGMAGTGNDPSKRLSFNWGDSSKGIAESPKGADYKGDQPFGTWRSQKSDSDSILTYYRYAIRLRNMFPEIGRGTIAPYAVDASGKIAPLSEVRGDPPRAPHVINTANMDICAYTLTWKDKTVLIVHNIGIEDVTVDISGFSGYSVVGSLTADGGEVSASGNSLTLPAASVAVLKAA